MNFYHVTTTANFLAIQRTGLIDPALAKGKRKLAWYVKREDVPWSIAHCIQRHKCGLNQLVVLKVNSHERFMHQIGGGMMWATKVSYKVLAYETAASWLVHDELRQLALERSISGSDWYEHLRE